VPDSSRPASGPDGGDAACWLSEVCAECGALNESPTGPCWRCGAARDTDLRPTGSDVGTEP
jgi:ribosomal protein L40E